MLCSDAGSLPEVSGAGALMFRSEDVDDLGRKLARLAREAGLRAELARAGRDRSRRFSWEQCAQGMIAAFEAAVSAAPSKPLDGSCAGRAATG